MKRIVFDFDNTMGTGHDTDDGLALLYLLGHGDEVELLGLTCTYGNSDVETVYGNTLRIARELGLDVPVLKGGANPDDVDNEASRFLAQMAGRYAGELIVLATGSLTNLKGAALVDPSFFDELSGIYLMGGITQSLVINGHIMNELNFSCDAQAAYAVMSASCPVNIATSHSCLPATFTKAAFSEQMGAGSWLMRECESWFDWMTDGYEMAAFICWDIVAAAMVVEPELFEFSGFDVTLNERLLNVGYLERAAVDAPQREICIPKIKNSGAFRAACFDAWKKALEERGLS